MDEQINKARIAELKDRIEANAKEADRLMEESNFCVAAHHRAKAAGNEAAVAKNAEHWQSVSKAQDVNGRQGQALEQEWKDLFVEISAEYGRALMDELGGGS